jgi:hypothetical protein
MVPRRGRKSALPLRLHSLDRTQPLCLLDIPNPSLSSPPRCVLLLASRTIAHDDNLTCRVCTFGLIKIKAALIRSEAYTQCRVVIVIEEG